MRRQTRSKLQARGTTISEKPQIRSIFVLEDVAATRDWLGALLANAYPDATIAAAASLTAARRWLSEQPPGDHPVLCLVDLGLPDGSGVDFIRELLARNPGAQPVVTTLYDDDEHLLTAMAAGAHGYLLKDHEPADIIHRLQAMMERGESPISPAMAARILAHFRSHARFLSSQPDTVRLTARETDVLRLIGRGLKVSEVAVSLSLSATTVSGYLKTVYRKLDIGTRAEAAVEAVRRGLV